MAGILKMGTVQLESSDGLKVASLTHGTDDILGFDKRLKIQGAEVGNPILASYTVTGSAVTSIDFTGLDINAHGGSYEIELRLINATASISLVSMFINGDTVSTNYYYVGESASTTVGASRNNSAIAINLDASSNSYGFGEISIVNGYTKMLLSNHRGLSASMTQERITQQKTATVTNITQLTFTASVASSIGVGSQIIIRRKDK